MKIHRTLLKKKDTKNSCSNHSKFYLITRVRISEMDFQWRIACYQNWVFDELSVHSLLWAVYFNNCWTSSKHNHELLQLLCAITTLDPLVLSNRLLVWVSNIMLLLYFVVFFCTSQLVFIKESHFRILHNILHFLRGINFLILLTWLVQRSNTMSGLQIGKVTLPPSSE